MNSEELELSLRTEFESYLKNVLAEMRQEVSEFQKKFEAEFEKHKSQLDGVFQDFSARIAAGKELDASFTDTVVEHLRLSRDEGARITATAIAEAEEMEKEQAAAAIAAAEVLQPSVGISEIRDAINDISGKTTQSTILKTLVQHAAQFTPRGAFFIIKNEHLVGWRVFGKEGEKTDEQAVREVFFPVASSTILGEAVRSLTAVESSYGTYSDDSIYLNKLEFGQPDRMFAVPLVVRGRAVAVLYADYGTEGENVNIEALETLVRVASLTVEILASSRGGAQQPQNYSANVEEAAEETTESYHDSFEESQEKPAEESAYKAFDAYQFAAVESASYENVNAAETEERAEETTASFEEPAQEFTETASQESFTESDSFALSQNSEAEIPTSEFVSDYAEDSVEEVSMAEAEETAGEDEFQTSDTETPAFEAESDWSSQPAEMESEDFYSEQEQEQPPVSFETPSYETSDAQFYESETPVAEGEFAPSLSGEYQFETSQSFETKPAQFEETPPFEEEESFTSANGQSYNAFETVETMSDSVVKQPSRSRFSERNVDLPIEVTEDERRLHNDARRFARLLVSEIKLYNEQKVKEGRDGSDLYERLREAIDRSREMYDKRVQPPVAAKFDYFHYELVSNLAEGDEGKLGMSYPGTNV